MGRCGGSHSPRRATAPRSEKGPSSGRAERDDCADCFGGSESAPGTNEAFGGDGRVGADDGGRSAIADETPKILDRTAGDDIERERLQARAALFVTKLTIHLNGSTN